jgi:putative aldouronate transport system permease protein
LKQKSKQEERLDHRPVTVAGKGRKTLITVARHWQLYLLILPAVVYLFIFGYMPIYGVQIAFRDYTAKGGITGSEWVGLEHIIKFIKYPNFWDLIKNTLTISIYSLLTFPLPIIFALMLNELKNQKFKKFVQMITYMPHFLSVVVVCSMLTQFFNQRHGVINTVIEFFGGTRTDFLTMPEYFADLFVWSGVWQSLGWSAIIYIAALSGIPPELVEAARIDGANRLQVIRHVNIPWIIPTIVIMLILSCGSILSVGADKVLLLQNSLNLSTSQVISTYVYEVGINGGLFSYSSAIGLFNNVVNIILLMIVNTISKKVTDNGLW